MDFFHNMLYKSFEYINEGALIIMINILLKNLKTADNQETDTLNEIAIGLDEENENVAVPLLLP